MVEPGTGASQYPHQMGKERPRKRAVYVGLLRYQRPFDESRLPVSYTHLYDLDENGERIKLPSGRWKSHKEDTVDWNDQKYCEIWRHEWEVIQNLSLIHIWCSGAIISTTGQKKLFCMR